MFTVESDGREVGDVSDGFSGAGVDCLCFSSRLHAVERDTPVVCLALAEAPEALLTIFLGGMAEGQRRQWRPK
jgi:hypothetical protein